MLTRIISMIDFASISEKEYESLSKSASYICAIITVLCLFAIGIYYIRCWYKTRYSYYHERVINQTRNANKMATSFLLIIDDKDKEIEKLKKRVRELESSKEITDAIMESASVPETGLKGKIIHNGL